MADRTLDDDLDAPPDDDDRPDDGGEFDPDDIGDDEDDGPKGGRGRLILLVAIVAAFVLGVAGGGYFFFLSGEGEETVAGADTAEIADDGTAMAINRGRRVMSAEELAQQQGGTPAPAASAPVAGFTPPPSQSAAPPVPAAPTAAPRVAAIAPAPAAPPPPVKGAKGQGAAPAATPQGDPGNGLVTPAVTAAAYRDIAVLPAGKPLSAPDPGLSEQTDVGTLPRARGAQGVWKAYARPFEGTADKPRIAVIVTGLGLSRAATIAAISQLPGGITLAFDPYARNLEDWVGLGRSNGHEALLHLPMEPIDFPVSDPGPLALLTDFDAAQNIARLHQVLASAIGYVGVLQVMGSKFVSSEAALRPVFDELKKRGVLFVGVPAGSEDRVPAVAQEAALPAARVDLKLDAEPSAAAIDAQLEELEKIARERGSAIAVAEAYPVTVERLSIWMQSLGIKEIDLAPVSALAEIARAPAQGAAKGAPKH